MYCALCFTELNFIMQHCYGVDLNGESKEYGRKPGCGVRRKKEIWFETEPKIKPCFEPVHLIPTAGHIIFPKKLRDEFYKYAFSLQVAFFNDENMDEWNKRIWFEIWSSSIGGITQYYQSIIGNFYARKIYHLAPKLSLRERINKFLRVEHKIEEIWAKSLKERAEKNKK